MINLEYVDLKLLRSFVAVVESGGLTAAANEQGVDLSTISNRLTALENRLGIRLCERGPSGFRLNEAGTEVLSAVQRLFSAISEFQAAAGSLKEEVSGELAIGVVDGFVTAPGFALHDAIRRFERRGGDAQFKLVVGAPQDLIQSVRDGRLHMAITGVLNEHLRGLSYKKLTFENFFCYCGTRHPLFRTASEEINVESIYRYRLISPSYWDPPKLDTSKFKYFATVSYLETQLMFLLSGNYLGYLPSHFAAPRVEAGDLRVLLPERLNSSGSIYLIQRRGIPRTRTIAAAEQDILSAFLDRSNAQDPE